PPGERRPPRRGRRERGRREGASIHLQDREERLLRDVHASDALHSLLALLLLLEELALPRDVAAVALREDVLADGLDRLAAQDLPADRRLDHDLEQLARDQLLHLRGEGPALHLRLVPVADEGERVDRLAVDEEVELHELVLLVAG